MNEARVLFLCTHNSARSQMAEGLLRAASAGAVEALSAGTVATAVRPEAIVVMRELGIDISQQRSKKLDEYLGEQLELVVTVCDDAKEACPYLPGARAMRHWSIPDPSGVSGPEEVRLAAFRAARDDLRARIDALLATEILRGSVR